MSKLGVVEDTLFVPMLGRIYASEHYPQILYDKKALELKNRLPLDLIEQNMQNQYTLLASASRSANMDRIIRTFLERRPDGVIVQLGCGLETTYHRCDNGKTHWYAVDLPHVIEYRRDLLPEPERELYISGDAFAKDWIKKVRNDVLDAPILVTAGGLFHYFEEHKVIALLRMLIGVALPPLLTFFYIAVFVLAFLVPENFRAVAFDSGGVTTGPMTVPFIMALGVGIASIRNDHHAADDSFGLVALCSIGPILAVMVLGLIYKPTNADYQPVAIPEIADSVELAQLFAHGIPDYVKEIALSLLPIVLFFGLFQIFALRLSGKTLAKILIGLIYTYIGLVLFLTGANVGFMPAGNYLGQVLAGQSFRWIIIPIGMLIGYFIVKAEPAVYVLNKQVEEVTDGAISAQAMGTALSAGVSISVGLAMVRVLTGISILWFLVPGYVFAIGISFVVPKLFTAIAFDAGGVASGPMTATFLLPLAQGACVAVGGNIVTDAFGVVAMVAMTPLITVQLMGLVAQLKTRKARQAQHAAAQAFAFAGLADDDIIEL